MHADPRDRARDLHAAFADPGVTAVLASIGGEDQITVIPLLDDDLLRAHPKPFFGFSDNTNLLNHLHSLGIVSYHGGSVMFHLGRSGRTHPLSVDSLRAALFTHDWFELTAAETFSDESGDWRDPTTLLAEPPIRPGTGWTWDVPPTAGPLVEGRLWGGCLEVLSWILLADRVAPVDTFAGDVLVVETSEDMPSAREVYHLLRGIGERGLLGQFAAVLVGRAKAWDFARPLAVAQRLEFAAEQRAAVRRAVTSYNRDAVVVFDLDIGHTDPQLVLPIGGRARVDVARRRISVVY
jgi:muramoyltetrapeptide carboxypeptidase LdcA involved in peptidoglycan recycling